MTSESEQVTQDAAKSTSAISWWSIISPALIVLAGLIVYANSFAGEFILDDRAAIPNNPTIRHLWPVTSVLFPEPHLIERSNTVEGRPLLNLSFALNYAAGGTDVRGYHVVNLAIHLVAVLLLYGVVRRTLLLPRFQERMGSGPHQSSVRFMGHAAVDREPHRGLCGPRSSCLALAISLIWVVHPLQTESVSYVAQRAESLAGMLYLLTLYLAIRGFESPRPGRWEVASVATCVLGMAVKEVMVTAPLLVLFYDATFVSGSLRAAWRGKKKYYLGLALLGWSALGAIMWRTQGSNLDNVRYLFRQLGRDESPLGPGHDVHWLDYARMQCWAVARYLRLSFWPDPLVLYYGKDMAQSFGEVWPSALLVAVLLVTTIVTWWRRPALGFVGVWFFLILAPTSSIIPLSGQTVAEHRMYLPLAAVVSLMVIGAHALMRGRHRSIFAALVSAAVLVLGGMTMARNRDYRTALSIWEDTVSKWPGNSNAQNNLAEALFHSGRIDEAMTHYRKSLEINPYNPGPHNNLATIFMEEGRVDEARLHYERSLELNPESAEAHNNLGNLLLQAGQVDSAIAQFHEALRLRPTFVQARNNLGSASLQEGKMDEAMGHFRAALEMDPLDFEVHNNYGKALLQQGRVDESQAEFERALQLNLDNATARNNLGYVLIQKGRLDEAMIQLRRAIDLKPDFAGAYNNLGNAFFQKGQVGEAMAQFQTACELQPDFTEAYYNLGNAHMAQGHFDDSIRQFNKALEINPNYADAHLNLGIAQIQKGNEREALAQFEKAVRLKPGELRALNNLAWLLAAASEASLRDGTRALEMAQKASELAGGNHPAVLHTLAAAYAESGKFKEAEETEERALALAGAQGNAALADEIRRACELYRSHKTLREASGAR